MLPSRFLVLLVGLADRPGENDKARAQAACFAENKDTMHKRRGYEELCLHSFNFWPNLETSLVPKYPLCLFFLVVGPGQNKKKVCQSRSSRRKKKQEKRPTKKGVAIQEHSKNASAFRRNRMEKPKQDEVKEKDKRGKEDSPKPDIVYLRLRMQKSRSHAPERHVKKPTPKKNPAEITRVSSKK